MVSQTRHRAQHSRASQQRRTPIFVQLNGESRVVGHVVGTVFLKRVRSSVHMLRTPRAWGFDVSSLDDSEAAGASRVRLHDLDTGTVYSAPISRIRELGFVQNRGHNPQIFLTLSNWDQVRSDGDVVSAVSAPKSRKRNAESEIVQLSLFGGAS